jgi:hypothetical protein
LIDLNEGFSQGDQHFANDDDEFEDFIDEGGEIEFVECV